jgi:hypothetical protein
MTHLEHMFKVLIYICDTCDHEIKEIPNNFEVHARILDEIDGSY